MREDGRQTARSREAHEALNCHTKVVVFANVLLSSGREVLPSSCASMSIPCLERLDLSIQYRETAGVESRYFLTA